MMMHLFKTQKKKKKRNAILELNAITYLKDTWKRVDLD